MSPPAYVFCRPQDPKRSTRYLFVGLSPGADLSAAFSPFEIETIVGPTEATPYVAFAVLTSEEQAVSARELLSSDKGRDFGIRTIKFSDAKIVSAALVSICPD